MMTTSQKKRSMVAEIFLDHFLEHLDELVTFEEDHASRVSTRDEQIFELKEYIQRLKEDDEFNGVELIHISELVGHWEKLDPNRERIQAFIRKRKLVPYVPAEEQVAVGHNDLNEDEQETLPEIFTKATESKEDFSSEATKAADMSWLEEYATLGTIISWDKEPSLIVIIID